MAVVHKLIKKQSKKVKKETVVILPDIRSTYNVGSFFRTCDGAGIDKIYLCGYTPCPIDSFQRPRKDISKTALGAELVIPWEYNKDVKKTIKELKKEGKIIIAVEQHKRAVEYTSLLYKKEIKEKLHKPFFGIFYCSVKKR